MDHPRIINVQFGFNVICVYATFCNISVKMCNQFYGMRKLEYHGKKTLTYRKSLTNFITNST